MKIRPATRVLVAGHIRTVNPYENFGNLYNFG